MATDLRNGAPLWMARFVAVWEHWVPSSVVSRKAEAAFAACAPIMLGGVLSLRKGWMQFLRITTPTMTIKLEARVAAQREVGLMEGEEPRLPPASDREISPDFAVCAWGLAV
jgi:hypothetical protein